MSSFFHLPHGDRWYLIAVLVFALVAFLPWSRHVYVAGMALFGWLMAALMIFSPAIALLRMSQAAAGTETHSPATPGKVSFTHNK